MPETVEFSTLEGDKENVQPIREGRSAQALSTRFQKSSEQLKRDQKTERTRLEEALNDTNELDDPIAPYLEYLEWISYNFPQGFTQESGVIAVLERCTHDFKEVDYYKNDVRYLRVWIQYARYSDSPRDVFAYLFRKQIGVQLALYYEEFASYLESAKQTKQAEEVFCAGVKARARPLKRLERHFQEFKQRVHNERHDEASLPQNVLVEKRKHEDEKLYESRSAARPKLNVYTDTSDQAVFDGEMRQGQLGTVELRRKENVVKPTPWAGEKIALETNGCASRLSFEVFRDQSRVYPVTKMVKNHGKKDEKLSFNLDMLMGQDEECCLMEILAISRNVSREYRKEEKRKEEKKTAEKHEEPINPPQSPTMTAYSKAATAEVYAMINQPIEADVQMTVPHEDVTMENPPAMTPIHEAESDEESANEVASSSPFIEHVKRASFIDPVDPHLRKTLLEGLEPKLEQYAGFSQHFRNFSRLSSLEKFVHSSKGGVLGNKNAMLDFKDGLYCVTRELGKGGFGTVFLAESSNGEKVAIKGETPANLWEFYILRTIESRLRDREIGKSIVRAKALEAFPDESYLILDYANQGTLLDVLNIFRQPGKQNMCESFAMLICIELLKVVVALHEIGIIHGDLKPDNCMVRFERVNNKKWSASYSRSGRGGWGLKGLRLIDFGRAYDMTLLPEGSKFQSHWPTDNQDCVQMRTGQPWSHEADYYGVASIVHLFLFGDLIEVEQSLEDRWKIVNGFKRYWQRDLWSRLFDTLLNGNSHRELDGLRAEMEQWLERNSTTGTSLKSIIEDVEHLINK